MNDIKQRVAMCPCGDPLQENHLCGDTLQTRVNASSGDSPEAHFVSYLTRKIETAKAHAQKMRDQNRPVAADACANYATAYEALIGEIEGGFHTPDALPFTN
jgi:hypothetical protein